MCPRRRTTCTVKQKIGSQEWSVKQNKCLYEVQETMDKQFKTQWREAEAQIWGMLESSSAQIHQVAASLRRSEMEHEDRKILQMRNAYSWRHKPPHVARYGTTNFEHCTPVRRSGSETYTSHRHTAGPPQGTMEEAGLTDCNTQSGECAGEIRAQGHLCLQECCMWTPGHSRGQSQAPSTVFWSFTRTT